MVSKNEKFKGKTNESLEESDLIAVTGGAGKPTIMIPPPAPGKEGMEAYRKKKKDLRDKGFDVRS